MKAEGGRTLKRWVAECDFAGCKFNDRKSPTLNVSSQVAVRESITHAVAAGHVGARQVSIRRTYTPRTIASEEIVVG